MCLITSNYYFYLYNLSPFFFTNAVRLFVFVNLIFDNSLLKMFKNNESTKLHHAPTLKIF